MSINKYIRQTAELSKNSGAVIDMKSHLSMVSISWRGGECFMQGDEADQFCDAVETLWKNARTANLDDCELCEAWPYIENLGN